MKELNNFGSLIDLYHKKSGIDEQGNPQYDFLEITQDKQLAESFKINIVGSSTVSTSNNAMLELMIRLAQTMSEDGMPMVTRDAVLDFLPKVNKDRIMQHFAIKEQKALAMQQKTANGSKNKLKEYKVYLVE